MRGLAEKNTNVTFQSTHRLALDQMQKLVVDLATEFIANFDTVAIQFSGCFRRLWSYVQKLGKRLSSSLERSCIQYGQNYTWGMMEEVTLP